MRKVILSVLVVLFSASAVFASSGNCSDANLKGSYGLQISGTISPPGAPVQTIRGIVNVTFDGAGSFTQTDNVHNSVSGIQLDRPGSGTYSVNADCTGQWIVSPAPGLEIVNKFVLVDNAKAIKFVVVAPSIFMVSGDGERK